MIQVPVALATRSYDIHIGSNLLQTTGQRIKRLRPTAACAIITDENVNALHGATVRASLDLETIRHTTITIPPGEASKSFAGLEHVVNGLLAARIERGDLVLALGGGVVGDLAGFAAGIVRRGADFVQIPTTLLAQVDSSVGGKTGINTAHGKNLAGLFYQPQLVLADTAVLDTLPVREFAAGYAEIVKYGLLGDAAFFSWLEQNRAAIFAGTSARAEAIATSCRMKAAIVARDERETGDRALLNLGHTFGHALEAATGYSQRLLHGEGVAIGMVLAFEFSARLGLLDPAAAQRVAAHLAQAGLPTQIHHIDNANFSVEQLMTAIRQDKKVVRGTLTFILNRAIGDSFVAKDVNEADVAAFLAEKLGA